MANLKEESKWEPGIRQFETSDPVQGGPDGVDNIALKQLGNRTRYLKDRVDAADKAVVGLGTRADATDKKVSDLATRADASDKKIGDLGSDKLSKSGDTMKGCLLGKAGAITPNNTNNVGFGFERDPDTGMFSPTDGHLQIGAQGVPYVVLLSNNLTLGAAGWLSFIAGKTERGRITPEGRWLLGGASDDGSTMVHVNNPASGYAVAARRRNTKQFIGIGSAPGLGNSGFDNVVVSYSDPGAPKSLILGARTDEANTPPSGNGILNIRFTIQDVTRAHITQEGNFILGVGVSDGGIGRFQSTADATGYGVVARRHANTAQYIGIGAAPNAGGGVFDNCIDGYSQVAAGKILFLNSTTDESNSVPTGGRLGIGFNILGKTKMMLNQAGRLLIGGIADDGSNLLQVGGGVSFASRVTLTSKQANIEMGSTTEAGTPYIDFHSSGAPRDFDARIIAKGGDATADGTANLQYLAGRHSFLIGATEKVTINSAGRVLIGGVADDGSSLLRVGGTVTATAPPAGDRSDKLITSAWFAAAVANVQIGQIVWEARTAARAGFLKLNGTELKRADYPLLWAYAQASGAIVADADWSRGRHGCFSTGDGNKTFRLPDLRGEFVRCWDDARGVDGQRQIGSWQDSQNRSHAHSASAAAVGDHTHGAWTDAQGIHAHGVNDPGHAHTTRIGRVGVVGTSFGQGSGPYNGDRGDNFGSSVSGTGISIAAAGNHGHNVGIGGAGAHSHTVSIGADGGNESRPRNVALLAMIRAY
ncbi:phage-related tail fiber protein [Burkholderia pseudomultivorans]|uniref:Phage-related tail fiber protein n=1 Tax=Burkholderia pseudomultivorans TaxID=1207504 RepID=A0A6P2JSF1_9BURK|nr:phage tail protein [Burkholderia pseudomultivorans]VWB45628.1 phage-related tail fiber protein [Burkholderia pseudomultivorans]